MIEKKQEVVINLPLFAIPISYVFTAKGIIGAINQKIQLLSTYLLLTLVVFFVAGDENVCWGAEFS